ncbi:MAG TPA: hypothetical protein VF893_02780 [Candidatus Bathyarchaeia archaeon]
MSDISKTLAVMILFNALLGVAFVYSNYYIWNKLDEYQISPAHWNPITVSWVPAYLQNGEYIQIETIIVVNNYPFWLFWIAMIGNILFAVLIYRSKKA